MGDNIHFLGRESSSPTFPVQIPVTDGFCQMVGMDMFAAFQISDGSGYFQDAVVCSGR